MDPCLYVKKRTKGTVYIALYVGDNLMTGDIAAINDAFKALKNKGLVQKMFVQGESIYFGKYSCASILDWGFLKREKVTTMMDMKKVLDTTFQHGVLVCFVDNFALNENYHVNYNIIHKTFITLHRS